MLHFLVCLVLDDRHFEYYLVRTTKYSVFLFLIEIFLDWVELQIDPESPPIQREPTCLPHSYLFFRLCCLRNETSDSHDCPHLSRANCIFLCFNTEDDTAHPPNCIPSFRQDPFQGAGDLEWGKLHTGNMVLFSFVLFWFFSPCRDCCSFHLAFIKHLDSPSADLTPQENATSVLFKAKLWKTLFFYFI